MGLNWSYNFYLRKDKVGLFLEDISQHLLERAGSLSYRFDEKEDVKEKLFRKDFNVAIVVKVDEVIWQKLQGDKLFFKKVIQNKTTDYCTIGRIHVCIEELRSHMVWCNFEAATSNISEIMYDSKSVKEIFMDLCKKYNPELCFFDFETSLSVVWFKGEEIYKNINEKQLGERSVSPEDMFEFIIRRL